MAGAAFMVGGTSLPRVSRAAHDLNPGDFSVTQAPNAAFGSPDGRQLFHVHYDHVNFEDVETIRRGFIQKLGVPAWSITQDNNRNLIWYPGQLGPEYLPPGQNQGDEEDDEDYDTDDDSADDENDEDDYSCASVEDIFAYLFGDSGSDSDYTGPPSVYDDFFFPDDEDFGPGGWFDEAPGFASPRGRRTNPYATRFSTGPSYGPSRRTNSFPMGPSHGHRHGHGHGLHGFFDAPPHRPHPDIPPHIYEADVPFPPFHGRRTSTFPLSHGGAERSGIHRNPSTGVRRDGHGQARHVHEPLGRQGPSHTGNGHRRARHDTGFDTRRGDSTLPAPGRHATTGGHTSRADRPSRTGHATRETDNSRADRPPRTGPAMRAGNTARQSQTPRADRPSRTGRASREGNSPRDSHAQRADRPPRTARASRGGNTSRPDRPSRADRPPQTGRPRIEGNAPIVGNRRMPDSVVSVDGRLKRRKKPVAKRVWDVFKAFIQGGRSREHRLSIRV